MGRQTHRHSPRAAARSSGRPVVRSPIGAELRLQSVLDALEAPTAILNQTGVIAATNRAWKRFTVANGGEGDGCGVGANYLDEWCAGGDASAAAAFTGLARVLNGSRPFFALDYPRPFLNDERWFTLSATALPGVSSGAVVAHVDVTARHRSDEARRASEARFRALVQASGEIIVIFDAIGALRYGSPALERILGHALATYGSTLRLDLVHPDDVAAVAAAWESVAAEFGCRQRLEYRVRRADGEWVWLDAVLTNLVSDPAVGGMVLNARDITDRKATEAALTHECDLFTLLLDHLPDHVFFKDNSSRFVRINRAGAASLGLRDPAEAIGKTDADFGSAEEALAFRATDREVFECRLPMRDRLERMTTGSGDRWFSTTKAPTFDPDGNVSGLVGISRDVTERVHGEAALRASKAHKTAVLAAALDAVMTMDAEGRITEFNPAAERIFGHRRADILGAPFADLVVPSASPEPPHHELVSVLGIAEPPIVGHRLDVMARRADGDLFPAELAIVEVQSGHQEDLPSFAAYLRDVTDAKRLEDELRRLALHDWLTGLPNRTLFADRLDQAFQLATHRNGRVAILFLDLDRFKGVNDDFGHAVGDAILKLVAERLHATVRAGETLARFGGDEFVVLLEGVRDPAETERVADRLLAAVATPIAWHGQEIVVDLSIGIALGQAGEDDPAALLRAADAALYQAKALGRGKFVVFTPGMADDAARRLDVTPQTYSESGGSPAL